MPKSSTATKERYKAALSSARMTSSFVIDDEEEEILNELVEKERSVVLMPLDASEHSLYAMMYYIKYVHKEGNMVYVCYCSVEMPEKADARPDAKGCAKCYRKFFDKTVVDVGPSPGMLQEWKNQDRLNYHTVRHRAKHLFRKNNIGYTVKKISTVDPADGILAYRKETEANMIIMGSRGQGAIKRRVFGSVSDKVMKNCLVPVLVVKTQPSASAPVSRQDTQIF